MQSTNTLSLKKILIFIILAILVSSMSFLILPGKIYGATLYVGGTEPGNYATIQSAITAAGNGDTIIVAAGTYPESLIIMDKSITLKGAGATKPIIHPKSGRGVFIASGNIVNISGFTITGGKGNGDGGGINNHGTLTITNSTISGNEATGGGHGIVNYGTLTITHSTITGNKPWGELGTGGGGIRNFGTLTINYSTISENTSGYGGGIWNAGKLNIAGCTISGNEADVRGGGVNNIGTLTITNSTISGNTAPIAAGIYNEPSNKFVVNAEKNWWGSSTGPTHSSNPLGTGDSISDNVDYIPWLTSFPVYDEPKVKETDRAEIIKPWVRDVEMTCYQVWINEDNNFEFVFWWEYKNNNWVKIYDMEGTEVFAIDMKYGNAKFEAELPDGMYTVKTFHLSETPIQEFIIGKP